MEKKKTNPDMVHNLQVSLHFDLTAVENDPAKGTSSGWIFTPRQPTDRGRGGRRRRRTPDGGEEELWPPC